MLDEKRKKPGPYSSVSFLLESAESLTGRKLDPKVSSLIKAPEPSKYLEHLDHWLKENQMSREDLPQDREQAIYFYLK